MTEKEKVKRITKPSGLRLPDTVMALLKRLSAKMKLPMTSVTVIAIRDLAKKEGVPETAEEEPKAEGSAT